MFRRVTLILMPLVLLAAACTPAPAPSSTPSTTQVSPSGSASSSAARSSAPESSATPTPTASKTAATKKVHVSLLESDGAQYGVGLPIIAWFNRKVTDASAFAAATTVKVNGKKVSGAWYFEYTQHAGSVMEAHYRTSTYWPGHARIELDLPVAGLTAGPGLSFDNSLTLSMATGAANILTVNAATLKLSVMSDGRNYGTFPVSLGASNTPTARGTKVIMEKGADISMRGPGYYDPHVQWTQRLTYGGEYLHSAPWNVANLGVRSTSNGCTNLSPAVAKQLYNSLEVGDVVQYPNASGPQMQLGQGYGDWNVSWSVWQTGGAVKTS